LDVSSDQEVFSPESEEKSHDDNLILMVSEKGNTSKLIVGRLNTTRAFTQEYFNGVDGDTSKEISVLVLRSTLDAWMLVVHTRRTI
jgi:hypothetical protein